MEVMASGTKPTTEVAPKAPLNFVMSFGVLGTRDNQAGGDPSKQHGCSNGRFVLSVFIENLREIYK